MNDKANAIDMSAVLAAHAAWLAEAGGSRADLREADLSGADLRGADLRWADFRRANLRWADLHEANLSWADLREADLRWADLRWADLRRANLRGADLRRANLRGDDLSVADLRWVNLRGADLREANLSWADLREAIDGEVCRMDFGGWSICVSRTHTSIGCVTRDNDWWLHLFSDDPILPKLASGAAEWWRVHGDVVKAAIRCVHAKAEKGKGVRQGRRERR